jgi:hypothetical protein
MKATKKEMDALHGVLSNHFKSILQNPPEEGLSPAMLNTIRQFLKDNGVGVELTGDEDALSKLREAVPFKSPESIEDVEAEFRH